MYRIFLFIIFCFLALLAGFFFAGVSGALLFGFLMLLAWKVLKRSPLRAFDAGWFFRGLMLSVVGYLLMWFFGLLGSDRRLHDKIADMRAELEGRVTARPGSSSLKKGRGSTMLFCLTP
jgi:hypothetical protein